jgi:hypothetical protein
MILLLLFKVKENALLLVLLSDSSSLFQTSVFVRYNGSMIDEMNDVVLL